MPDKRTVLMGDDATNGGLFMFVADKEKDLSAGTLYVAKVGAGFSVDPAAAGAPLTWIKLGHATSAEIEALADTLKPADIMSVKTTDPLDASYSKIFFNGKANWVKLMPGMEKAAAFLETHRYAASMGASMGFTKMEGTTVNVKDKVAYSALQNIQGSMVRGNASSWRESTGITVEKAIVAGGVFAHTLAGGQKDIGGAAIASEWVPVLTKAFIIGEDIAADALGNLANPDKVANPDNLKFSEKLRTLFIGEDSGTARQQLPVGLQRRHQGAVAHHVDPGGRRIDGPARGRRDQRLDLHHEQLPARRRLEAHPRQGQATLDPLVRANYKGSFWRRSGLPDGRSRTPASAAAQVNPPTPSKHRPPGGGVATGPRRSTQAGSPGSGARAGARPSGPATRQEAAARPPDGSTGAEPRR